jgi:hypothetical protein
LEEAIEMTEYFLPADQWPRTLPRTHKELLQGIIEKLSAHSDLLGLAIGGSFVSDQMDQFSDLDLKVIADPGEWETVREARKRIAASVGPLVSAFTAEHVGVPQMLICMYGDMLIHVDLHFMVPEQLASIPEDPVVLWDRDGTLHHILSSSKPCPATVDWQWIEDRFWTWIHYTATRAARGELFETIRFLSFLLWTVLGPIAVEASGGRPHGLRRFEQIAGSYVEQMRSLVTSYDKDMAVHALFEFANIYRSFRKDHAPQSLMTNPKAEAAVVRYLEDVFGHHHRKTT